MIRPASDAERSIRRVAFVVALLLNAVFIVALYFGTKPHAAPSRSGHPLIVRLIAPVEPLPVEAPEPMPPSHRHERSMKPAARAPASGRAPAKRLPGSVAPSRLHLFDTTGRILLPESETALHAAPPSPHDLLARANPLPYRPTRFDRYFPPVGESLGGEIVRKTQFTQTWLTPWGTQVTCSGTLILAILVSLQLGTRAEAHDRRAAAHPRGSAAARGSSQVARPARAKINAARHRVR